MQQLTRDQRIDLACGYEPLREGAIAWSPVPSSLGFTGMSDEKYEPSTCPGYTTRLPEVVEVARALRWRGDGELRTFCDGQPSEQLIDLIDLFDVEVKRYERWATTSEADGGGREVKS